MGDVIDLAAERIRRRPGLAFGMSGSASDAPPPDPEGDFHRAVAAIKAEGKCPIPIEVSDRLPPGYAVMIPGNQIVNVATGELADEAVLAHFAETGEILGVSRDRRATDTDPEHGDPESPKRRRAP